jgi:hypothetical protein
MASVRWRTNGPRGAGQPCIARASDTGRVQNRDLPAVRADHAKYNGSRESIPSRGVPLRSPVTRTASSTVLVAFACVAGLWCIPRQSFALDPGFIRTQTKTPGEIEAETLLQPWEPLTGGYTKDSDDVAYVDINLSVKFRLLPVKWTGPRNRLFFAMSTRFGFYWNTRPGSPVIGKSYNPELLWRFLPNEGDAGSHKYEQYLDFGYAHQSNGQLVHTLQQYEQERLSAPQADYANNFIHRGWDYLQIAWKKTYYDYFSTYLDTRYFLPVGLLQGPIDEYHSWENNPQGKPRKQVDGLDASIEFPMDHIDRPVDASENFGRLSALLKYRTGYDVPFRYSTVRAEFGFQFLALPAAVWVQVGYMSDLAMYYQKVTSYGIEVRFLRF